MTHSEEKVLKTPLKNLSDHSHGILLLLILDNTTKFLLCSTKAETNKCPRDKVVHNALNSCSQFRHNPFLSSLSLLHNPHPSEFPFKGILCSVLTLKNNKFIIVSLLSSSAHFTLLLTLCGKYYSLEPFQILVFNLFLVFPFEWFSCIVKEFSKAKGNLL